MAKAIVPEANADKAIETVYSSEPAKRLIFQKLDEAWVELDEANNRVCALTNAIELAAKQGADADRFLLRIIEDTMQVLWSNVDGIYSDLRSDLGIKTADYEAEAHHG